MQKKMMTLAPFIFHIFNSFFALHVFESPWLWDKKPLKHHSPQSNMFEYIFRFDTSATYVPAPEQTKNI